MSIPAGAFHRIELLDAIISRAEAACERYREAAQKPARLPGTVLWRRQSLQQMEIALARLQAERRVDQTEG